MELEEVDDMGCKMPMTNFTKIERRVTAWALRALGWTVFCDEEEDDVQ